MGETAAARRSARTRRPRRPVKQLLLRPLERFLELDSASGLVLMAAALAAFAWANSPWAGAYGAMQHVDVGLEAGPLGFHMSLAHWVNDGLMAVFFFLVGLEIKREVLRGELAGWRRAALPVAGALGGMVAPALIYAWLNRGTPEIVGWGVPMATDIAFAVGVMTLLGPRVPAALKVFLLALAIVDDLGAVLVIALFYTAGINAWALGGAALVWLGALAYGRAGGGRAVVFAALGLALWALTLASGVHATVAGVMLALTVPLARPARSEGPSPLLAFEHALQPWVSFGIMPLFALFNAGVAIGGGGQGGAEGAAAASGMVALGAFLGLIVGKPVGIVGFSAAAVALRLTRLPDGVGWRALTGAALLGGIGFTMALFIAVLAFGEGPTLDEAKLGVLAASACAAVAGYLALRAGLRAEEGRGRPAAAA